MMYKGFGAKTRRDPFGNLIVWLPFGVAGAVIAGYDQWDDYTVTREDLENAQNNQSLVGLPVVLFHPESTIINPDNPYPSVGVCTGNWRETDGDTFEVEAKLTDKYAIELALARKITETSPGYLQIEPTSESEATRVYNHLALTVPRTARGGSKMQIKFESNEMTDKLDMSALADAVVLAMKTESEEMRGLITAAKNEGISEGLVKGRTEARLFLRAEALGVKAETITDLQKELVGKFLPALAKYECTCDDQMYATTEAALAVGEAQATVEAQPVVEAIPVPEAEKVEEEKAKTESRISRPKYERGKTESIAPTRPSANFLLLP